MKCSTAIVWLFSSVSGAAFTGCGCTAKVSVTNQSDDAHRVRVVCPYPAYQLFKDHCRYEFDLQPGTAWTSRAADRSDFEVTMPPGGVILRVCPKDLFKECCASYWCDAHDYADIIIKGEWPSLEVTAKDRDGTALEVRQDTETKWFVD